MENFIVDFYRTETNQCPVVDFLDSLPQKMRTKMLRTIELLENHGTELRLPYSEYLNDSIFELRAKQGTNITRVLYFFVVGRKVILTHGFIKKTQKTPAVEIEKAKRIRADYYRQEAKNE